MRLPRLSLKLLAVTGVLLALAGIATAAMVREGRIGPDQRIGPDGRKLEPVGRLTKLGNLPAGAALTQNGRYLWTLSAGESRNDIRIVDANPAASCPPGPAGGRCRTDASRRVGRVVQNIPMPGLSGGIATAPDGRTVYVSGTPESLESDARVAVGTPGRAGDVVHVFRLDPGQGAARRAGTIELPPPPTAPPAQSFPPSQERRSWPRDLAVSPDGRTLLAALNLADHAAVVDLRSKRVRYVRTGSYPYGAAITRDGRRGLVSNESDGTVSVIDLRSGRKLRDIQVGPHLSHPEAIAADPVRDRAYVAVTHQDLIAVLDTKAMRVVRTLSAGRPEGIGTNPVDVSVTRDGCRLLSADSGEDAVAVFSLSTAARCAGGAPTGGEPGDGGGGVGPGGEDLVGTEGDDVIRCGSGNDRVDGRGGNDVIFCGSGNDVVRGGSGNDRLYGESGDDLLDGGPGDDLLSGGGGNDRLVGGSGRDRFEDGSGRDRVEDGSGSSTASSDGGRRSGGAPASDARSRALAERDLQTAARRGIEDAESTRAEEAELLGEAAEERAEERLRARPAERSSGALKLIGRIPTASYPVAAEARTVRDRLAWVTAEGFGIGPNPRGPNPLAPANEERNYPPALVTGYSGSLPFPSDDRLRALTPRASRQIRPANGQRPPAGTPIAPPGKSPLKHVFYIVRENRTYDQVLGDEPRGDGDPKLTLFPKSITPNAHALAKRFPLLDHVYANSEASIDGHFWTSAAAVSDYTVKNWHQNYAGRGRPYDFGVYAVTWPSQRFLFDRAEKQGISYFNYGEAVAGTVPFPSDKDKRAKENAEVARKFAKSDLGPEPIGPGLPPGQCYVSDASSDGENPTKPGQEVFDSTLPTGAKPTDASRFSCFQNTFRSQVTTKTVPAFNYVVLPNDHTAGTTPGSRKPQSMIAENDLALGQMVEEISKSPIWRQSLILVIEDDSQNGADHVDAHRIPAFAISPYARRGAVVHTRYDFLSFIRTFEIPLGLKPLNLFDALATPLYNAFTSKPANAEPYEAITPRQPLLERNSAGSPNSRLSQRLPLEQTDRSPQRLLDKILWQSVHGPDSEPPPPGPNGSSIDERAARGYERSARP